MRGRISMRIFLATLALSFALPITACSRDASEAESAATVVTIEMAGTAYRFDVEVARTDEEQKKGLKFRTSLPANGGMLFPFAKPRIASFWMQDTLIPLDMLFIRADGSIDRIAENTIPGSLEPVASGGEVSAVLEIAGGTATKLGIDESARVTWKD